ncbi:hypothetical protein P3X46_014849 [Hevea brasiliensis]|uniref:Uncharacterized protein n=1 Tax=Hevea brasiliensis TaxID=3981 RepID=A0ABQ9LXZ6_HEVBR|nr:hypothetical protein P3X46_014849 [Hevea brasiliensis]
MRKTLESQENEKGEEKALPIWDLGSPLYDSYELVSLCHHIERHLMILPSLGGSRTSPPPRPRKICPVPGTALFLGSDHTHCRSSMVNPWSEFLKARLWRRRMNGIGHSLKEKPEKAKAGVLLCGFHNSFGLRFVKDSNR